MNPYNIERCYGKKGNLIDYCSNNLSENCSDIINPLGDIVTCSNCAKVNPNDKGNWLIKNNRRIWIPECICPSAVRNTEIKNIVNSNIADVMYNIQYFNESNIK